MTRRRLIARAAAPFVAAVVTVGTLTVVAGAHDTDVIDQNDTRGKLDVRKVGLAHQPGPPVWTIITFGRWGTHEMWDRGYLMVMIDTQFDAPADHYLLIRSKGSALEGSLWRIRAIGPDSYLGSAPTSRKSLRSASVQVRLNRLAWGPTRTFYRWWVQTILTGDICTRTCQDRAPNGSASALNWRPGMSPTPTPSPSPSGSPSP